MIIAQQKYLRDLQKAAADVPRCRRRWCGRRVEANGKCKRCNLADAYAISRRWGERWRHKANGADEALLARLPMEYIDSDLFDALFVE